MAESNISMIVLSGGKKDDPHGTIYVEFVNKDWSANWSHKCVGLEAAFKAIRHQLAGVPDNVVPFG